MMYGEEKKSNLKKTSSSSTFGTKIADSKMGTQCGGGVLFLHQQHSAVGPRAAGSEEHVVQGGGLRGDQASKFGFCPRARAQAEVKSPAINILRPNDVLTIHFALAVLQEDNSVVTSGTSGPVLYRGSGGDMEEVGFECVENIILNGQFSDYIVVCQGREYKCHLV